MRIVIRFPLPGTWSRRLLLALPALGVLSAEAAAKNMLANSSFEVGIDHKYAVGRWYENGLPSMSLDETTKVHGAVSLKVPFSIISFRKQGPFGIELRGGSPVMVEKGKTYTFSASIKTDVADVDAALAISPIRPFEYRGHDIKREKITLGRQYTPEGFRFPWKRDSITFTADKSGEVFWVITVSSKHHGTLWVDALQFEEGPARAYAPALDLEVGLFDRTIGHIHDAGAAPRVELRAYNDSGAEKSRPARLRVLNDGGTVVSEQTIDVGAAAQSGTSRQITLDTGGANGIFIAELTLPDAPGYLQDTSFTVLPKPRRIAPEESAFGAYITPSEEALKILSRAGFHWTATLTSAERMANWGTVETSKGRYAWQDDDVELFRRYGFEILMNLEGWNFPGWAKGLSIQERTQAFANYVEAIVGHYRGKVRYFTFADELHNKIPGSHMLGSRAATWANPEEYAKWHAVAFAAAKRANKDSRIVLNTEPGGFGPDKLFRYLSPKMVDVLAANYYPYPNTVRDLKKVATNAGISSFWAPGVAINTWPLYYRYERPLSPGSAQYLENLSKTLVRTFANGADVFFHYSATYVGNTNVYSIFEHDSSLETGGAQFASLAWLLDGFKQSRRVPMARAGRIETYRFDRRDGRTVFALWSQLQSAKQRLIFKQPIRNVEIFDRMTTLVAQSGKEGLSALPLGEESRFLVVPTAEADQVGAAIAMAGFHAAELPKADKVESAGRYALLSQAVGKEGKKQIARSLWYKAPDDGWVEVLGLNAESSGQTATLTDGGLLLRFRYAWDGRAGHLVVGSLPSDLFWGERFWRSMPDRGKTSWQEGRIADDNMAGRMVGAKNGSPPPNAGLSPVAYAIKGANGLTLAIETEGEQPSPRFPMPGGWDIYVWRGEGPDRTLGIWRYVHGDKPRERDFQVRLRIVPG